MSVEVEAQHYLFDSRANTTQNSGATNLEAFLDAVEDYDDRAASRLAKKPGYTWRGARSEDVVVPFRNNPLHDFESIYWLALYLPLFGEIQLPDGAAKMTSAHMQACQTLAGRAFANGLPRLVFLRCGKFEGCLHPMVSGVVEVLDGLRQTVVDAFMEAEASLEQPIPFSVSEATCEAVGGALVKVIEHLKTRDIVVLHDGVSRVGLPVVTDSSVQEGKKRRTGVTTSSTSRPKTEATGSSSRRKTRATGSSKRASKTKSGCRPSPF